MSVTTEIWDRLKVTDPKHTKGFNRAGGFKGTAIKPQWVVQRMTEEFGPVGIGWGMGEPSFQVVEAHGDILVYATVTAWFKSRTNTVVGVGGDKVASKRSGGVFVDDEAFKKAYTDALMNAFKFLGVGADVHMGLFDDSKYVQQAAAEHRSRQSPSKQEQTHGPDWPNLTNPATLSSHAAKQNAELTKLANDIKARLAHGSSVAKLQAIIEDVTPDVARLPETWRRVLWGEFHATLEEIKEEESKS